MKKLAALLLALAASVAFAQQAAAPSQGQTLYLPVYSHIWYGDPGRDGKPSMLLLSALVSIRNVDAAKPISLVSARYFDTDGKLIREYAPSPRQVPPLGAHELHVPKSDTAGGSGASFVITWRADSPVSPPVVEAVHAEVLGTRSLAFTTSARVLESR